MRFKSDKTSSTRGSYRTAVSGARFTQPPLAREPKVSVREKLATAREASRRAQEHIDRLGKIRF
jgi:hypothetical protein